MGAPDRLAPRMAAALASYDLGRATVAKGLRAMDAAVAELRALTGGASPEPAAPDLAAGIEAAMRAACAERGLRVTGDGRVSEADAAALLNRRPNTLRGWRGTHRPIPFTREPTGRISYRLADLAAHVAAGEPSD